MIYDDNTSFFISSKGERAQEDAVTCCLIFASQVNEHKKSLRGEKMYVNKSAEKNGGCRCRKNANLCVNS